MIARSGALDDQNVRAVDLHAERLVAVRILLLQNKTVIPHSSTLVMVEDYISGIHVFESGQAFSQPFDVLINYGTKVNLEACHAAAQYSDVVVWLDNDSPHVIQQAWDMQRTIILIEPDDYRNRISTPGDPKHYHMNDITRIVIEHRGER